MKPDVLVTVGPFKLQATTGRQRPVRGEVRLVLQTMRGEGFPASEAALDLLRRWLGELAGEIPPAAPAAVARAVLDELRRRLREEWPRGKAWGPSGAFRLVQVSLQPPEHPAAYRVSLPADA